jgi:hypothetical protein
VYYSWGQTENSKTDRQFASLISEEKKTRLIAMSLWFAIFYSFRLVNPAFLLTHEIAPENPVEEDRNLRLQKEILYSRLSSSCNFFRRQLVGT